ncbi:DUF930 domain-containing protein [Aliirhizobium smilacinae]|uniref:DUF930 domain-containing protein n=1 Tax=Aliirhizobium smilacinae TaxID=1395944 RepID=A0A5C4XHR4_9HYPH|nr:DUF930 domain-containing protein [Rhizobium smilacinae]TNM63053.1 DUF930 domain-containing protein [Rhizobium smilacinae]
MQEASPKPRHKLYGGIAVSVALHVIIAVALFVRLPAAQPVPPEEESVSVEIVPPPEEQKPEEKASEQEQALNLTMPETKPEEQEPPPEPPPQPAEEAAAAQPPPPLPPAPEEKPAEEIPPAAEQPPPPEEQAAEQQVPPPPETQQQPPDQPAENSQEQAANGQPLPVLRPVFEFGEESKGSGVSTDGDASEEGQPRDADETNPSEAAQASEATSADATDEALPSEEANTQPAAPALPQDVAPPLLETANADPLATSENGTIDGIQADIAAEPNADPVKDKKPDEQKQAGGKPLKEAKRLFSQADTSDAVATTAMGSMSRGARAGDLCTTELREQLRHGSPAYQPEILPSYSLSEGNVLDIRSAGFRANAQWYEVRFRCEIDQNATKVVSFGLDVGDAVPRSQWKARRFPEF